MLLELPTEIFTEVAMLLDWTDVLNLRQVRLTSGIYYLSTHCIIETCKHLSQATRAKSIWVHFFNVSNVSHPWSPLCLERPLEFYTSQELECLIMRRTSIEIKRKTWTSLSAALIRRLPINNSDIRALTLINGGRWLLVVSRFGSVSYYDLDTQEPVKRLLIPAARLENRDHYHPCTAKIAVDMDNESAVLSFNLALYTCKGGNSGLF